MFKKLLNVGKGHLSDKQQQHQQQHKDLFQLNEIRSYGFSHLTCLGYSPTLSLLAVGSKLGLLRVLGNPSVEFSHQLESGHAIRQIEFIDCRSTSNTSAPTKRTPVLQSTTLVNDPSVVNTINGDNNDQQQQSPSDQTQQQQQQQTPATAKIICLTDDGQLHLLELKTVKQIILNSLELTDNTTQTTNNNNNNNNNNTNNNNNAAAAATAPDDSCCQQQEKTTTTTSLHTSYKNTCVAPEYTKLEKVATFDLFVANNNNQQATIKVSSSTTIQEEQAEQSQEQLQQQQEEQKSRKVTTIEISLDAQTVYVGTEGGSVYQVPLEKFSSFQQDNNKLDAEQQQQQQPNSNKLDYAEEQYVLAYDDIVATALPDDMKAKKASPVEAIKHHPTDPAKILVGYQRGLTVLLDINKKKLDKFFYHNQVLESLCWSSDASNEQFYTSHNDGSYVRWDMRAGNNQTQANNDFIGQLYGPYPCKPTSKIQACKSMLGEQQEDLVIFSGGLPRARYDGKNPVTIVKTDSSGKDTIKTVLDFTSKVLDFIVITKPKIGAKSGKKNKNNQGRNQVAVALAVLAEEEFVVIDLLHSKSDQYLEHALPYLNCVHSSAITCNQHYSDISDSLYEQICQYNQQEKSGKYSPNEWPITGGKIIDMGPENKLHDLLLTGHEDGSVHFWDVSGLAMKHLLHLTTSKYFGLEDELIPIDNDEQQDQQDTTAANDSASRDDQSWPPFKRVGQFDPYSDDARLAVRKFSLCPKTGCIVVVGTAGEYLVFN